LSSFLSWLPRLLRFSLFPYTTLFRSEMRGRLVHQNQVGRVEEQLHQRQPALLAAAQHAHFFEHVVAAKEKTAEHSADELLGDARSEEHTSELQSRFDLVCRLLLEKKK